MSRLVDITVTVHFHREGELVLPALASMRDMVDAARTRGLDVEARAVLDRPDELTSRLVASRGAWLCGVEEVSVGDLGLARNAAVRSARGEFVTLLDGDDLWGAEWLHLAHSAAKQAGVAIWHPECLYHFCDFEVSNPDYPELSIMEASDAPEFDRDVSFFGNFWSANTFALREVFLRHPYRAVDRNMGFGVEDWSWNMETLLAGIPHCIVRDTVHLIRKKNETGSLHLRNVRDGLLPYLPADAWSRLGVGRHLHTRSSAPEL